DLWRLLSYKPGDERVVAEPVDGESNEHGDEEDPEDGEDSDACLADDLRDDAEDGERHREDNPSEYLHEPGIDMLNDPYEGIHDSTTLVSMTAEAAKGGAEAEGQEHDSNDVAAGKRSHDGTRNIGGEVFDRTLGSGLHCGRGAGRWLGGWYDVQQILDVAIPG